MRAVIPRDGPERDWALDAKEVGREADTGWIKGRPD